MKASVTTLFLSTAVLMVAVNLSFAQSDSWFPGSVTAMVPDCITQPGVNAQYPEPPDILTFAVGSRVCDDYDPDVLERPTIQGPEDAGDYFPSIDIDTVWFGLDATWLYVGVGIRGLLEGTTMEGKPHFELDSEPDGRGDFLVMHEGGKNPDDFTGSFASTQGKEKLSVFSDGDEDVGGSLPFSAEGTGSGNGYDTEVWKSGESLTDNCSVRQVTRAGSGLPRFDFACRLTLLGNPTGGFAIRVTINKGSNDPANFYLHDKYNASEYGSPYSDDPNFESGNTYEIDNTPWAAGNQLPVELGAFDVVRSNDEMVLSWTTFSETDNSGFEVQHAIGTRPFEAIAFVPGAGTTVEQKTYTYRYPTEEPGLHRFRLKQIDFDGAFAYSQAVEVAIDLPERFVLEAAYPNPFNPNTTIRFGVSTTQELALRLYDALGRQVRVLYSGQPLPNEMHSVSIDAEGLSSGNYVVRLEGASFVTTRIVTLLK